MNYLEGCSKIFLLALILGPLAGAAQDLKDTIYLKPVVIEEKKIPVLPFVKSTVIRADIEMMPSRDVGDYLRTIPNVSGVRKGGTGIDPVIRGFKFDQVNVRLDNFIRIEGGCPNRMDPTAAHVELEDIDRIEVIKGPYALKYGPAFGAFVNLITTKPEPFRSKKFEIYARGLKGYESNWNGDKEHVTVKGGNKYVFFNLSGSNKRYGNYEDGNGDIVRSHFHKYNYRAELGVQPVEKHNVIFSFSQTAARDIPFPALPMDERTDDTKITSFVYTGKGIGKNVKHVIIRGFYADVKHVMDNKERPFADTVAAVSDIHAITQGLHACTMFNIGESSTLLTGVAYENTDKVGVRTKTMYKQNPVNDKVPEKIENLMDAVISNTCAVAEFTTKSGNSEFVAAARVDFNSGRTVNVLKVIYDGTPYYDETSSDFTNISVSAGYTRHLTDNFSLGLSAGRGVRSPNMIERYVMLLPIGYDNFDYLGNPQVKPEANHQVDLTATYASQKLGSLQAGGFFSYITDYIGSQVLPPAIITPNSKGVLGVKYFVNTEYVIMRGFEITYISPAKYRLNGTVNLAYTRGTSPNALGYELDALNNVVGPKEIGNDPLPEIPPLSGYAAVQYSMFQGKLVPKVSCRFAAKQDYVSVAFNERVTPGHVIADFSMYYHHNKNLSLSAGVSNIFDKAYYEHLNRRMIGTNLNLMEPGRVFFINMMVAI